MPRKRLRRDPARTVKTYSAYLPVGVGRQRRYKRTMRASLPMPHAELLLKVAPPGAVLRKTPTDEPGTWSPVLDWEDSK